MQYRFHQWATLAVCFIFATVAVHAGWSAEGLQAEIENVIINDQLKPEVTFTLKDDSDAPVAISEIGSPRFIIGFLRPNEAGSRSYVSYIARAQTVPAGSENAGASSFQATYDSGGNVIELSAGRYLYTFGTALPPDYDQSLVHTVSAQITRTVGDKSYHANPLYHWIPNGSPEIDKREVVTTDACNKCHTSMGFHGGGRKEVGLCIMCHNPDTLQPGLDNLDPNTGNSIDMTAMIHKIHMSVNLPSVQAGGSYQIVGHNESVHDYSNIHMPIDMRNCTVCHTEDAEDSHLFKSAPSMNACGSCHDDVSFITGEGHGLAYLFPQVILPVKPATPRMVPNLESL